MAALSRRAASRGLPFVVGVILVLPLMMLLVNSFNVAPAGQVYRYGLSNWQAAFADQTALGALWNSFALAIARTAISMPIALILTWLVARTDMPGRNAIEVLAWISIFVPVLPLAFGWVLLLDPSFGLLNALIGSISGSKTAVFNIYSFWGITWVHLASTSIAYKVVLLAPAFRRVSAATEQAARVCGATARQTIIRITLPLLAPAVLLVTVISLDSMLAYADVKTIVAGGFGIVSLWNQAPHPNAAKVFANWIASKEGTSIYGPIDGSAPVRTDVDASTWLDPDLIPKPGIDYFDVYDFKYVMEQRQPISRYYASLKGT